jgi:hypothetical protein
MQNLKSSFLPSILVLLCLCATASSASLKEFGQKMSYFYLKPTPEAFAAFQQDVDTFADTLASAGNNADLLTAVMIARISEKHHWPVISKSSIGDKARTILEGKNPLAQYVLDDKQIDPSKLDIWWASFFATGDEAYLEKILVCAGTDSSKADPVLLLIYGSATWSFKANCKQHEAVRSFAQKQLDSKKYPLKAAYLEECIAYASK